MKATRTTTRMAVLAILALAGATAAAAPALAGDRGHKNGHRNGYWGPPGPAYYYAPPRVYYAPPPVYYAPPERGFERELKKRIDYFAKLRAKRQGETG